MPKKRASLTLMALSFALATELAIGLSWASSAQAQFRPPLGTPGREVIKSSPTRSCARDRTPLTVLMPSNQVALTTEARPTFFFYRPRTIAKGAEFLLIDSNDNDVYRTLITLPEKSGLVGFQLPADAPPLEVGKEYRWYFSIICEPRDLYLSRADFVAAWIQRIEPNQALVRALKTATPRKRPNLYAQAGIWQDTLTTLAELQRTNPTDRTLTKELTDLLKSVGLGQVTERLSIEQLSPEMLKTQ